MRAIHINWTRPYFVRHTGDYDIEDFELLTTILSALKWREKNGSIKMVTDSIGAEFYRKNGMEPLWDGGIEAALDGIGEDPDMFWAAGKLHALKRENAPVAVIDTDFIVWESIIFDELPDLTAVHDEDIYPDVYPHTSSFRMRESYNFDGAWDMSLRPLNTAFYVIKSDKLIEEYTDKAIEFMRNAGPNGDRLTYMVFAEQRLLPMCAKSIGFDYGTFSSLPRLFANGGDRFTHVWGMKQQMREDQPLREAFCRRCADRIKKDFPKYAGIMSGIEVLGKYIYCSPN